MRIKWTFAILAVAALAALGVAACGDDDDDGGDTTAAATTQAETTAGGGGGGAGGTVQVSSPSGSDLAYNQTTLSAPAGTVTVDYTNPQPISHDVTIEDSSGQEIGGTDLVSDGTAEATVDLQPGSYTFFCSVPGHREAGMEGTLTVQ
jgi:plastocyanin